ncbi:hypothetical protein LRS73_32530 (plasmid) [Methylobacterium currus]|uniref:hypothetical protein n=1 Tax=Methylobacterium currus TaxID=2051553 RepID=UPI001E306158|nr:hypothetical protein [Methylobacterium currus]UHC20228.1 hypothetical protein LRS73_32530 [Methylobacterium currus]
MTSTARQITSPTPRVVVTGLVFSSVPFPGLTVASARARAVLVACTDRAWT